MESKKLTIFFTSDLHAYIYPTDYRSREERDIGLFKCASRFTRDGNTLIIDGGDLLQGSPLGAFCHDTLQNADPFAEMMNCCGYDYVTLGNHDFNYGMPYLESYLNALRARCVCQNIRWDGAHTVRYDTVKYGTDINLNNGPLQEVKQLGKDGMKEIWVGRRSKKEVDKGFKKEPQNLVVQSRSPRPAGRKVIALTFDDGPSQYSDAILDILKEKGVKATFFDVGESSAQYPKQEKRMLAEGHQVASHSNTHPYMPKMGRDELRAEITAGFDNLKKASGLETKVMRAPYGAFGVEQWKQCADLLDMNVLWDIDTEDWKMPGAQAIHDAVLNNAHNGAVVLMHDGGGDRSQDVEALPGIIDDLKKQGYEFVTIEQLSEM